MSSSKNKDLLEAIRKFQSCPYVHEMTCGNDSRHETLKGIEIRGKVVLICPDCDYVQNHVPDFVWGASDHVDAMEKFANMTPSDYNKLYEGEFITKDKE